jgi:hypothetical protein
MKYIVGYPSAGKRPASLAVTMEAPRVRVEPDRVDRMTGNEFERGVKAQVGGKVFASIGGYGLEVKRGVVQDARINGRRVVARVMSPQLEVKINAIDREIQAILARRQEILDLALAASERVRVEAPSESPPPPPSSPGKGSKR